MVRPSASTQQLNRLESQRAGFQVRIQNLKHRVDQERNEQCSPAEIEDLLERLVTLIKINEENYDQILCIMDVGDNLEETETDYSAVDEELTRMKIKVMEWKNAIQNLVPVNPMIVPGPRPMEMKLPKMDIPKFGGNFNEWESFKDLLESIYKNNMNLSGAQKLQFLKLGVIGDAANLIRNLQITNGNFEEAWKILINRYDNKREIVNSHLNRLFKQPALNDESASGLRQLIDCTNEAIRALKVLNEPTEHWGTILVYLVSGKLDSETRRQWELSITGNELPTFEKLTDFLEQRARALKVAGTVKSTNHQSKSSGKQASAHHGIIKPQCGVCSGDHYANKCEELMKLTIPDRIQLVKNKKLCFNCLSNGHSAKSCERGTCRRCKKRHHTLLHLDSSGFNQNQDPVKSVYFSNHGKILPQVLLATALVKVPDVLGTPQLCRVLLDQGSEANFITEDCVQRLGLRRRKLNVNITGLGSSSVETAHGVVNLDVSSHFSSFHFNMDALVLKKITGELPKYPCGHTKWTHVENLTLADPEFYRPGKIDILIGAEHVAFLMKGRRIVGARGSSVAQESELGWILSGPIDDQKLNHVKVHHGCCDVDSNLRPGRWKTFVANRVAKIQGHLPKHHWHHVAGMDNPADIASRGISPSQLENHHLWWHGPQWLSNPSWSPSGIQSHDPADVETMKLEEKVPVLIVGHLQHDEDNLFFRFSSLWKLNRIAAWCLRFQHNCRFKGMKRRGRLSTDEMKEALNSLIKIVQDSNFEKEIVELRRNGLVNIKSELIKLSPFIKDNLVRVGGRLRAASIPEEQKFPILLPKKHKLTELIVAHYHLMNLHAGPELMMAAIKQKYWIIGLRDIVRRYCKNFVNCQKTKATVGQQMMADLPSARLTPGRPFLRTGVDYAGPIQILNHKGRGSRTIKGYVVIFVCFATRAMHLEPANDLTAPTFIAALKRFISRRGRPTHIYCDNGRNFCRGDKDLRAAFKSFINNQNDETLHHYSAQEEIHFQFNPPASPHFGGLWEAGIKSVKFHLKRVTQNARLTYVEMVTLLTQIESCLNSRPLTAMSTDPDDLNALTPGHFLIGGPLNSISEPDMTQMTNLTRWQLTTRLFQHFWKRWAGEYLTRLQQRPKWMGPRRSLKIDDIVIIKQDFVAPLQWRLGRVIETHAGNDGHVRDVTLKTATGKLTRSIHKLCLLPIESSKI